MKRFLFFFLILFTWYMAAMYRLQSLMALAVAEIILLFLLFFLTRYLKKNLTAGFCENRVILKKGEKTGIKIWIENSSVFPVGRYRLEFTRAYKKMKKIFSYEGSIDGKKRQEEELPLEFPLYGKFWITLAEKQVYDYLSLFKFKTKERQEAEIFVLPSNRSLNIEFLSGNIGESRGYGEADLKLLGNSGEIRQLRKYMPGDLVKRIHWKQSARTDQLLVKEFQQEEEESVFLYLDFSGEKEADPKEMSAFYQILSGVLSGLLKKKRGVQVSWRNSEGRFLQRMVQTEEESMSLFLVLYDMQEKLFFEGISETNHPGEFILNIHRELYFKDNCVCTFSLENFEEELEKTKIIIP